MFDFHKLICETAVVILENKLYQMYDIYVIYIGGGIMTVKIRKVGTSDVLTVPQHIKKVSTEYQVFSGRDGAIIYLPKQKNPFKDDKYTEEHLFNGDYTGFVKAEINEQDLQE